MGDILSGVFGGGSQTEQSTLPDEDAKELNRLRKEQLRQLFSIADMSDFAKPSPETSRLSKESQRIIARATDRDNLISLDKYLRMGLNEGEGYIKRVASPEIMSTLAAQGMERSGVAPAAIAKATSGIALPFLSSIPQFTTANVANQAAMLNMTDLARQLKQQDFLRRQGIVQTGFTGIPFSPGSKTRGSESQLPFWNMFGMGGSL